MQQKKVIASVNEPHELTLNGSARRNGSVITLTTGQHQHILLGKLNPNLWASMRSHLGRIYGRVCYSFCAGCCCCCPDAVIPASPVTGHYVGSSQCSHRLPAWFILSTVWLIAILLSYPHSLFTKIVHYDLVSPPMIRCIINNFPNADSRIQLTLYTFITQYLLPIGLTTYFYLHIGMFLWRRETVGATSEGRRIFLLQRKRRRVRMLILVVLMFAVCWFPLNLYIILTDYNVIPHHQCKLTQIDTQISKELAIWRQL